MSIITGKGGFVKSRRNRLDPIAALSPIAYFQSGDYIINGSGASQWNDSSGNNLNLIQNTSNSRPTLGNINGVHCLDFNGGQSMITASFNLVRPDYTFILVERNLSGEVGAAPFSFSTNTTTSGIIMQNNGGMQPYINPRPPYNSSTARILQITSGSTQGFINGASNDISFSGYANASITLAVGFRQASSIFTSGSIGMLAIIPGTITVELSHTIHNFLAQKWLINL